MNLQDLKSLRVKLIIYNLIILLTLGIFFFLYTFKSNYYVAEAISENLHNELAFEDHSVITRKLSNIVPSNFSKIIIKFADTEPITIEENPPFLSIECFVYKNTISQTEINYFFDLSTFIKYFLSLSIFILFFGYFISKKYLNHLFKKIESDFEIRNALKLAELSKQVAHDIRSPLSALNMVISTLNDLPNEKLQLINTVSLRINDIANDLLSNSKKTDLSSISKTNIQSFRKQTSSQNLEISTLLENVIIEKKAQFCDKTLLKIKSDILMTRSLYLISESSQLLRIISNLINNAAEAINDNDGEIIISVREYSEMIQIVISDNGPGIPEKVTNQLGIKGFTTKLEGNGLGLYHAKQTLEAMGGQLSIISKLDVGTFITLQIPKSQFHQIGPNLIKS